MPQKCGSSRAAVSRLNKEIFFLAEIFICSESQSSSLKWSGHNVFVLLFFFLHFFATQWEWQSTGVAMESF